jgi:hypothetical protein
MRNGFDETGALEAFNDLKYALADALLDATWAILSDKEKSEFASLYSALKLVIRN